MPKKKSTGPGVPKCPEAAKTLADCRWKKDRQNKLNKEVDAMEAKAKIYDIKAKAKEATAKGRPSEQAKLESWWVVRCRNKGDGIYGQLGGNHESTCHQVW